VPERLTIPALLLRRAQEGAGTQFLVTDDDDITYAQLDAATRRVVAALVRDGVGKGTRVGLLMPNGIDWAVIACGVMRSGAVLVPLSTFLRPPELHAQLLAAGVEHLVVALRFRDRDYVDDLRSFAPEAEIGASSQYLPAVPRLRTVRVGSDIARRDGDVAGSQLVDALDGAVRPADDMVVIFTSGSRGAPKGVIHTHGGALAAVKASLGPRCLARGDRLYIPMPFFWMGGFGGGLLSALVAGATLITESEPEPTRTLALLERERVTLFRGWPDQAAALAAHPAFASADLGALRDGSLDAVLPPERRRPPGARSNLFGMTESFGPYCADRLDTDLPENKWGSCGRPFAGIEVRVVDVETGDPVAAGVDGEIQLRGPNLMRGICGRLRSEIFTPDGFYPAGDLGRLDEDGYLFFVGRRDDMLKVKGATVYPAEVEAALVAIPGVRRAFVVDIDDNGSVALGAAVVLDDGAWLTPDDLTREAKARLSAFKVPGRWAVVDLAEIPTTATGKLDKSALQALITQLVGEAAP
jgi:acyl-CoA synthetase (AMP-forming)/AMP-acid ligase II